MEFLFILLFLGLGIGLFIIQQQNHERKINEYVESLGGYVITIEHKTFATGPFILVGKGRTVYRFEYSIGNQSKEGWVKFGSLFGPDWRL